MARRLRPPNMRHRAILRLLVSALAGIPAIALAAPDPEAAAVPCQAAAPRSVEARVVGVQLQGDHAVVTLSAGSGHGVAREWSAVVLEGTTQQPLAGGAMTIIRVNKHTTVARAKLTAEQLAANPHVRLAPPTE